MDDISFCAVCDRQIVPKRTIVPIYAHPDPAYSSDPAQKKKQASLRQRSGLVHGTGRVRPNGTIKQATPVKTRVEIDQSPAPLYCSDDCRHRDTEFFHGTPVYASSDTSSDEQDDALRTACYPQSRIHYDLSTPNTRSLAVLQREYNMQPLPPPTTETYDEHAPRRAHRPAYQPPAYTSGIMMAHRRIDAILPKPLKPGERPPPLKPIPGWTDGSQAWRAATYSFAPPPQTRADVLDPNRAAYTSFHASPHRSAQSGVTASSASGSSAPSSPTTSASGSAPTSSSLNSEMLSSFEDSISRRASSRLSLASSPTSECSRSPPRKSRSHIAASAHLLVPDVLLRPAPPKPTLSSSSLASSPSQPSTRRHSSGSFNAQRRVRSPLSNDGSVISSSGSSDDSEEACAEDAEEAAYVKTCVQTSMAPPRPNIETRSWSYDNMRTYPVMRMPQLTERVTRVVNGVEVEEEVEVPRKRLFTFAPIPVAREGVRAY